MRDWRTLGWPRLSVETEMLDFILSRLKPAPNPVRRFPDKVQCRAGKNGEHSRILFLTPIVPDWFGAKPAQRGLNYIDASLAFREYELGHAILKSSSVKDLDSEL